MNAKIFVETAKTSTKKLIPLEVLIWQFLGRPGDVPQNRTSDRGSTCTEKLDLNFELLSEYNI